ncbi:hypothetical protein [Telmatospirillum siberiense]|uniref:Uncharacterized protein n=1 Tax=Telmatospirillum siberiense TaxID=382514 RepID=A0A2N3PR63_9PROT|nr:hypothetical protein [Telmatospirillum siberiense]PKU22872.1 hypothetical protein CWS72_19660 [Telmatospirillum siberiense]
MLQAFFRMTVFVVVRAFHLMPMLFFMMGEMMGGRGGMPAVSGGGRGVARGSRGGTGHQRQKHGEDGRGKSGTTWHEATFP